MHNIIMAHIQTTSTFEQNVQAVSWGLVGICATFFAFMWYRSFKVRNDTAKWGNAAILAIVFSLMVLDKISDILAIWYYMPSVNLINELIMSCVFLSWLIHNIKSHKLPIFMSPDEIQDRDQQYHESKLHKERITKILGHHDTKEVPKHED